jgi:hypothetical protein
LDKQYDLSQLRNKIAAVVVPKDPHEIQELEQADIRNDFNSLEKLKKCL